MIINGDQKIYNLSTCIIVKNEEKFISDCIKSVLDISSEVILLDTGSTDKTLEIASLFDKVKIFNYKWNDNYSDARNTCISYSKNNWILNIDADQRLINSEKLKEYLFKLNFDEPHIIKIKIVGLDQNNQSFFYYKDSIMTNTSSILYTKPIHETLVSTNEKAIYKTFEDIIIEDIGESSRSKDDLINKKKIYINKLENIIDIASDLEKIHYFRHLGDAYFYINNHCLSLNYFVKAYEKSLELNLTDYDYIVTILVRIIKDLVFFDKNYKLAIEYIEKIPRYDINNLEYLFYLGFCQNRLGDNGIYTHKKLLTILLKNNNDDEMIFNTCLEIGIFLFKQGDNKCLNFLLKAHNIDPKSNSVIKYIVKFFYQQNDLQKSALFMDKISPINKTIKESELRTIIQDFIF